MNQDTNKLLDEARLLMPWYLSGRLSNSEQALVDKALETYPELQAECAQEEKMMHTVCANTSLLELAALDTTEQRLSKLLTRIERSEAGAAESHFPTVAADAEPKARVKPAPPSRLTQWWQQFWNPAGNGGWLQPANAVFAGLLIAQVAVLAVYSQDRTIYKVAAIPESELQHLLSEQQEAEKLLFHADFYAKASAAEINAFLVQNNAEIVSGPSASGMYLLVAKVPALKEGVTVEQWAESIGDSKNNPIAFLGLARGSEATAVPTTNKATKD